MGPRPTGASALTYNNKLYAFPRYKSWQSRLDNPQLYMRLDRAGIGGGPSTTILCPLFDVIIDGPSPTLLMTFVAIAKEQQGQMDVSVVAYMLRQWWWV